MITKMVMSIQKFLRIKSYEKVEEEFKNLKQNNKKLEKKMDDILGKMSRIIKKLNSAAEHNELLEKKIRDINETVKNTINIGVDVNYKSDSWAVICIKGKPERVEFINLNNCNINEILSFLNQYKVSNNIINAGVGSMQILQNKRI